MYHHSRFISEIKVKCELFKIPSSNDSDKENCDKEDTKVINLTMMSFWECNQFLFNVLTSCLYQNILQFTIN